MLFSGDEVKKRVGNLSGGEAARLLFARLAVEKPNVLVLDEPTNHLDLEAIEALAQGLEKFRRHARSSSRTTAGSCRRLATRILEITPRGLNDFQGTYDEYLERLGDDHLDAAAVLARAKKEKQRKPRSRRRRGRATARRLRAAARAACAAARRWGARRGRSDGARADDDASRATIDERRDLLRRQDKIQKSLERAEARVHEINEQFSNPGFFGTASRDQVRSSRTSRSGSRARSTAS